MTPDQKDRLVGQVAGIGVIVLLCAGSWMTGVRGVADVHADGPKAQAVRPFADRIELAA